jgi:hypothetical protein
VILGRAPGDIDFVAPDFAAIPASLAAEFLFRHVHPHDPPGKMLAQFVDPETAVRVDVFRACGGTLRRARDGVVSRADVLARLARLLLDPANGVVVPAKHADDYLLLTERVDDDEAEIAWPDHRRPSHPATFREARETLRQLIPARRNLHMTPEYSRDITAVCGRCLPINDFPLSDAKVILNLLGYC